VTTSTLLVRFTAAGDARNLSYSTRDVNRDCDCESISFSSFFTWSYGDLVNGENERKSKSSNRREEQQGSALGRGCEHVDLHNCFPKTLVLSAFFSLAEHVVFLCHFENVFTPLEAHRKAERAGVRPRAMEMLCMLKTELALPVVH
jgi:hypothetical protein